MAAKAISRAPETDAAFVAIDEVQLAGDLERGHIFTDRILHLRGRQETLLLGAATMHGILQRLLHRRAVLLALPADEPAAVIFDRQLEAGHGRTAPAGSA